MSILKYKDPKTGEFKRINPYKADLSFVGKDGIVVNKAANSEEVEISGSGCVQKDSSAFIVYGTDGNGDVLNRRLTANPVPNAVVQYSNSGRLSTDTPINDLNCTNKKYVNDNYVEKVKFTNLEQALNGYILDTTKEAYANLDSAVLKNSVAVGDNVYPIADKTRALVTRIEGKTTKMVQLLDKSTFPATSTPTAGVTVTKTDDGGLHVLGTSASSGGRNSWGITVKIEKGHKYLSLLKGNNKITTPFVTLKSDTSQYVGFVADIVTSTIEGECYYGFNLAAEDYDETIYPQLFDLTAMNREDITTAEQFKAEFPDLYPYENGNIYPAKISGVKFTGKNLFNPLTPKYSGQSSFRLDRDNIIVSQSQTATYISANFELPNTKFLIGKKISISANVKTDGQNKGLMRVLWAKESAGLPGLDIITNESSGATETRISSSGIVTDIQNDTAKLCLFLYSNGSGALSEAKTYTATYSDIQVEISDAPTAYEPYTEPVSVTLPETYDLHGIGDYKDYLEITKNEDNDLYTLKKIQQIEKKVLDGTETVNKSGYVTTNYQSYYIPMILLNVNNGLGGICNKLPTAIHTEDIAHITFGINNVYPYLFLDKETYTTEDSVKAYLAAQYAANDPLIIYYIRQTPVETVIATNLTYEQVTAIRHNGGLIEVEGNTNKGYARPTIKNTIVYRLTATNTAEG